MKVAEKKCQRRVRGDNGRSGQAEKRTAAIYLLLFPARTRLKYTLFKEPQQRPTGRRRWLQATRPSVRSALQALIEANALLNPGRRILAGSSLSASNFINQRYCCHPITITPSGLRLCETGTQRRRMSLRAPTLLYNLRFIKVYSAALKRIGLSGFRTQA